MREAGRYTKVAIALHWAIAAAILVMIPMGFWMHRAAGDPDLRAVVYQTFQFHKSLGLTILVLSLARLAWRLMHKPPPMPPMPAWEALAARATHVMLYGLMIALPLTGWLYVSIGWSVRTNVAVSVPTLWFGLFQWPHLPFFHDADAAARGGAAKAALTAHWALAWGALGLAGVHVGAALKHHFRDKDEVLVQMLPWARKSIVWPILAGLLALFAVTQTLFSVTMPEKPQAAAATENAPLTPSAAPPASNAPAAWRVDKAASAIKFSGMGPAGAFTGGFSIWDADIRFSPDDLAGSKAVVTIRTSSVTLSDPDGADMLKGGDWFASAAFPTATFTTTAIRHLSGERYAADGMLNLRGKSAPVKLAFTLRIAGNSAAMQGEAKIERLKFDVGKGYAASAAGGEAWASGTVAASVTLRATR